MTSSTTNVIFQSAFFIVRLQEVMKLGHVLQDKDTLYFVLKLSFNFATVYVLDSSTRLNIEF